MPRRHLFSFAICMVGFALLYRGVLEKLIHDWLTDDNYSHGLLIIPLSFYFAFQRRADLIAATIRPAAIGFPVVLISLVTLVVGSLGAELFLTRVSMLGVATGAVLFIWGTAHARILMFPLAFLLLMVPLPAIVFNQIALPLQSLASRFGEGVLRLASVPVLREGNVIVLANTTLEVAEACSGIRSLVSLLTLGIVLGYFSDQRGWVRTAVAVTTIPVAIAVNGLRVAGTGIAAHRYGPETAMGFFHEFSGWLLFLVALLFLLVIQRTMTAVVPARSDHTVATQTQ